jgi:hypothetical protein
MAFDWLPKVGLALVTVSVDPPLSKQNVELIRTQLGCTPKIVILFTKSDLVTKQRTRKSRNATGSRKSRQSWEVRPSSNLPSRRHADDPVHDENEQASKWQVLKCRLQVIAKGK